MLQSMGPKSQTQLSDYTQQLNTMLHYVSRRSPQYWGELIMTHTLDYKLALGHVGQGSPKEEKLLFCVPGTLRDPDTLVKSKGMPTGKPIC